VNEPLFLRADANADIGAGHFMRLLAFAQFWKEMGERPVFL
jgi:spore coat polysaccharide biosynthesis predicted glycosyltransferase SpsG